MSEKPKMTTPASEPAAMDAAMKAARDLLQSVHGDAMLGVTIIVQVRPPGSRPGRFGVDALSSGWCCKKCRNATLAVMLADESAEDVSGAPAVRH